MVLVAQKGYNFFIFLYMVKSFKKKFYQHRPESSFKMLFPKISQFSYNIDPFSKKSDNIGPKVLFKNKKTKVK